MCFEDFFSKKEIFYKVFGGLVRLYIWDIVDICEVWVKFLENIISVCRLVRYCVYLLE